MVLPDSFYDLKLTIYSSFLIGECSFSTILSGMSGIFKFFKHMSLRFFFQTILGVVQYISDNLKLLQYAPVVYVQNIKMCIHSQGLRFSTLPILVLFLGYSSGANQIYATIQNGHCKRFIFEIIRYSKAGGQ